MCCLFEARDDCHRLCFNGFSSFCLFFLHLVDGSQKSWRLFIPTLSGWRLSRRPNTAAPVNRPSPKMDSFAEVSILLGNSRVWTIARLFAVSDERSLIRLSTVSASSVGWNPLEIRWQKVELPGYAMEVTRWRHTEQYLNAAKGCKLLYFAHQLNHWNGKHDTWLAAKLLTIKLVGIHMGSPPSSFLTW